MGEQGTREGEGRDSVSLNKTADIVFGISAVAQRAAAKRADDEIMYAIQQHENMLESHIELIMLSALIAEGVRRNVYVDVVAPNIEAELRSKWLFQDTKSPLCSSLASQFSIGGYRADFCMCFYMDVRIVVECDGHDYHERSKEQAIRDKTRDRTFQAEGFQVFRFTGREIWRDGMRCAAEVFAAASRESDRRIDRENVD